MATIGDNSTAFARDQLKSFVERVERLDQEVKSLNDDKRDIYAEAKGAGFDVKALKAVIAHRRKDPEAAREYLAMFELYLDSLQETGTANATRARARGAA